MFSDDIKKHMSERSVEDIKAAGRCLAFELYTAVGFHLMRAIEDTMRAYYKFLTGESKELSNRNWANYIRKIQEAGGDEKVLGVLDQIRDMHRNPISHPEVYLDI